MAASPNPIIWDFYHEVKDAGVDSEPVGVVHYYDGDAQTFYLKNNELVTMTATVENSNWKGIDKRYSFELPILKFSEGTEKAKYDHPSNGTLYMVVDDGKDMYFLRYIYMIDASPILESWSLGLQADNPIINMNATIMNADPGLYDTDTSLFEPGSRYYIKSVFNDTDSLRLGMGFIDEVSYSHVDETISISGRNTSGFLLKDQTFNDRTDFKGTAGYVCREMLNYAGVKKYAVQDLKRSGTYEIKDTESILDGIQGVLELCYNENGMGTKDSIARIIELADGTICVGQSSWLEEKGYFQNAYYTFDRGSDVFSRKVKKDVDACYTAVRATGKKKDETPVDTPDGTGPTDFDKEYEEWLEQAEPGVETSQKVGFWRTDAEECFEKLKNKNDNPFTTEVDYWPWGYWAKEVSGMPLPYWKDFVEYHDSVVKERPVYYKRYFDLPTTGRQEILYVVRGDPDTPANYRKYKWEKKTGTDAFVYVEHPEIPANGREFTTWDWNFWIQRVPFYPEPEKPPATVDNFHRSDMTNLYTKFKTEHHGLVVYDKDWMEWAESIRGVMPKEYYDSLTADIGKTYTSPTSMNYNETRFNNWMYAVIPISNSDKPSDESDASYTDVVKYISKMAKVDSDFEVFGLKAGDVATKLEGLIDKIPLKGARNCLNGLIDNAKERAESEFGDLTFNIQEMLDWANMMDNPEDMLDNYLKDLEGSDSISTKNNMLDPVTVEVAHYDFWTYGKNRVKHLSAPDGLTQSQLREWAESQALKYQMAGIQEDFSGPYRPQLQIGDIAEFLQNGGEKTIAVTIGFVTSVTHSFSSKKGYTTDFTVESGGIDYESIDKGDTTVIVGIANSGVNRPTRLYDMNSELRLMQDKIETRSGCTEAKLNETLNAARQIKRVVGNQTDALRLLEQTVYWMWEQFKKTQTNEEV